MTLAADQGCLLIKLHPYIRGLPDRILLIPSRDERPARVVFVELKRVGRTLTLPQQYWADTLSYMGFRHWRIDSWEGFNVRLLEAC